MRLYRKRVTVQCKFVQMSKQIEHLFGNRAALFRPWWTCSPFRCDKSHRDAGRASHNFKFFKSHIFGQSFFPLLDLLLYNENTFIQMSSLLVYRRKLLPQSHIFQTQPNPGPAVSLDTDGDPRLLYTVRPQDAVLSSSTIRLHERRTGTNTPFQPGTIFLSLAEMEEERLRLSGQRNCSGLFHFTGTFRVIAKSHLAHYTEVKADICDGSKNAL